MDIRKILLPFLAAGTILLSGSAVSAAPADLAVTARVDLTYSGYAQSYDNDSISLGFEFHFSEPAQERTFTVTAPEGFSLEKDRKISEKTFSVTRPDSVLRLKASLYPTFTPDSSAKYYFTVKTGTALYKIPFTVTYNAEKYVIDKSEYGCPNAEFEFSEKMFEEPSKDYNERLARASLMMAVSAFSSDTSVENRDKKLRRDKNIMQFYDMLGFHGYRSGRYSEPLTNADNCAAYAISSKMIKINGEECPLVACAVRGGGYGCEWAGNFTLGDEEYHAGFKAASIGVERAVRRYIEDKLPGTEPVIWITGYSRGGAVAGLVADALETDYTTYAYTFAAPRSLRTPQEYSTVHNIILKGDIVPQVPPADEGWGFRRPGTDHIYGEAAAESDEVIAILKDIIPSAEVYHNYYESTVVSIMAENDVEAQSVDTSLLMPIIKCYMAASNDGIVPERVKVKSSFFSTPTMYFDGEEVTEEVIRAAVQYHFPNMYFAELFAQTGE